MPRVTSSSALVPLLDPSLRNNTEALIRGIALRERGDLQANGHIALNRGTIGLGVMCLELSRRGFAEAEGGAEEALELAVGRLNEHGGKNGLFTGIAGLVWLAAQLGETSLSADLLQLLTERTATNTGGPLISLAAGLAGLGVVAGAQGDLGAPLRAEVQRRLLAQLSEGSHWATPLDYARSGGIELPADARRFLETGVVHGNAGILFGLSSVDPTLPAVTAGLRWLAEYPSRHQSFEWALLDGRRFPPERPNSWCVGTVGITRAMWVTARRAADQPAQAFARSWATAMAERAARGQLPGQPDATLCCGLSSVLQIFARWYFDTGDSVFAAAARLAHARLLETYARSEIGQNSGLFYGRSGVALALASTLGPPVTNWDVLLAMHG